MFWIVTELHKCIYNRVSTHVSILQTFINTHIVKLYIIYLVMSLSGVKIYINLSGKM